MEILVAIDQLDDVIHDTMTRPFNAGVVYDELDQAKQLAAADIRRQRGVQP